MTINTCIDRMLSFVFFHEGLLLVNHTKQKHVAHITAAQSSKVTSLINKET